MFISRTKLDLIIEVWEKLDCESVGAKEIEAIELVVRDKFGESAVDSPMIIARELADEGAELRHAEILKLDVERRLEVIAKTDERIQRLQTIPGVGRRTAEVLVTALDDVDRFDNARQVSSYIGLVPRQYQSGETDHNGRITKRGSRLLRTLLLECAWISMRYNEWSRTTYDRIHGGQFGGPVG